MPNISSRGVTVEVFITIPNSLATTVLISRAVVCGESELLEVKVPIVFLGMVGFSARRERR